MANDDSNEKRFGATRETLDALELIMTEAYIAETETLNTKDRRARDVAFQIGLSMGVRKLLCGMTMYLYKELSDNTTIAKLDFVKLVHSELTKLAETASSATMRDSLAVKRESMTMYNELSTFKPNSKNSS